MVRWCNGGPIELFLVSASALRLVYQKSWYVLSCLGDGAYTRTLAANRCKSSLCGGSGFPLSLSGPLPYFRCHITVNKMC